MAPSWTIRCGRIGHQTWNENHHRQREAGHKGRVCAPHKLCKNVLKLCKISICCLELSNFSTAAGEYFLPIVPIATQSLPTDAVSWLTVELSYVGVASAVCIEFATSSRRLPTKETEHVENLSCRVELCRRCVLPVGCRDSVYNSAAYMWLAQKIGNWVTTDDWCIHTADTTELDFVVGKLFRLFETVAN